MAATAMAKQKNKTVAGIKDASSSSRKRSHTPSDNDDGAMKEKTVERCKDRNRNDDEPTNDKPLSTRPPKRKKQKKASEDCHSSGSNKKKPLAGMTISVSTLSDNTSKSKNNADGSSSSSNLDDPKDNNTETSYNEVCRSCRELGATVIDLVCKRVHLLVCSEAAVRQATQRVRKAIKRNKPLVSIAWLEECQRRGCKVDLEEYRLDAKAKDAIQKREDRIQNSSSANDNLLSVADDNHDNELQEEAIPDSGWSEPQDLGCCCVCHENGTTATCPWCKDCPLNTS